MLLTPANTKCDEPTNAVGFAGIEGDGDLKSSDAVADAATKGQAATGYEALTPWETVQTFKVCTAVCFAAAFSAATDGYQIG